MSCHLSHRLTTVHRAISMALLCSVGYAALVTTAQAATIGKTVVTSAQHEPLAASIVVTDIQSANFSASLANPMIYQQMGLTPTDSMTVQFKPTSATSGQVFISTSNPISKPFADVVLAIEDNGQRKVIPKTLLMPLNTSLPIMTSKNIVTAAQKPNLPSVSTNNAKPLTVREGVPPPLTTMSDVSTPESSEPSTLSTSSNTAIQAPTVASTSQNNLTYSRLDNGQLNTDKSAGTIEANNIGSNVTQNTNNNVTANKIVADNAATTITDKQLEILNIQITRQIQLSGQAEVDTKAATPTVPPANNQPNNKPNNDSANVSKTNIDTGNTTAATSNMAANTVTAPTAPNSVKNTADATSKTTNSTAAQYQVQRNDNLWIIAQQIAQQNDVDIQTVMKQIQSQNPDAFINKDAGQLKADAKLSLPSYDVLPSQKNLEAAISAQRQYSRRANTPVAKKTAKTPPKKSPEMAQTAKPRKKPTTTQTLPKAQFSVLAPDNNGRADGTQVKSAAATGSGLSTDILATLKAARQRTASQAQRLSKVSGTLDSYTKKIQLQNQKLAELQTRLKKLRNQ